MTDLTQSQSGARIISCCETLGDKVTVCYCNIVTCHVHPVCVLRPPPGVHSDDWYTHITYQLWPYGLQFLAWAFVCRLFFCWRPHFLACNNICATVYLPQHCPRNEFLLSPLASAFERHLISDRCNVHWEKVFNEPCYSSCPRKKSIKNVYCCLKKRIFFSGLSGKGMELKNNGLFFNAYFTGMTWLDKRLCLSNTFHFHLYFSKRSFVLF